MIIFAVLLMQQAPMAQAPQDAVTLAIEKVICRDESQPGTRITVPVCLTRQDWKIRRDAIGQHRGHFRPVIDNRRPGRSIGRSW